MTSLDHIQAAGRPRLITALEAVLDLHREIECCDEDGEPTGGYACEECKDLDDHSGERVHEVYPCPTVQQITAAISGQQTIMEMRARFEKHVRGPAPKELFQPTRGDDA